MAFHKILEEVTEELCKVAGSTYGINDGYCDEWADEVSQKVTGCNVEIWETLFGQADTTHTFIKIGDRFYDAECLHGVRDHMQLPIFASLASSTNNRVQPVWLICCSEEDAEPKPTSIGVTQEMALEHDEIFGTENAKNWVDN